MHWLKQAKESDVGDFGVFESLEHNEELVREANAAGERRLASAISDVRHDFGEYFKGAKSRQDFEERYRYASNDLHKTVAKHLDPTPGVMRRVRAALRPAFARAASVTKVAWSFDPRSNSYIAELGDENFPCPVCSRANKLGFSNCACGKIWNSYEINSADKTAGARRVICREVMNRSDAVLGSKKSGYSEIVKTPGYADWLAKIRDTEPGDTSLDEEFSKWCESNGLDEDEVVDAMAGDNWGYVGSKKAAKSWDQCTESFKSWFNSEYPGEDYDDYDDESKADFEKEWRDSRTSKKAHIGDVPTFEDETGVVEDQAAEDELLDTAMDAVVQMGLREKEEEIRGEEDNQDVQDALQDAYDAIEVVQEMEAEEIVDFDPEADEAEFTAGWHHAESGKLFPKDASKSFLEGYSEYLKEAGEAPGSDVIDHLFEEKKDGVPNTLTDDHEDYTDKSNEDAYKEVREDLAQQIDEDNNAPRDEGVLEDPNVGTPRPTKAP